MSDDTATASLYDTDFAVWAAEQARALRAAAQTTSNISIDWENVAEEIEALGKSQQRELASRISTILVHLIKLMTSPATDPRPKWRRTIRIQRDELRRLLKGEASLRQTVGDVIQAELPEAREQALADLADYGEQPRLDVAQIVVAEDQVMGTWFPEEMEKKTTTDPDPPLDQPEDSDKVGEAVIQHKAMDETTAYLSRGRTHAGVPVDQLEEQWMRAFRLWLQTQSPEHQVIFDDIAAELGLRGLEPPVKMVEAEVSAASTTFDPNQPGVQQLIQDYRDKKDKPKN
jgi:hypothetical protein